MKTKAKYTIASAILVFFTFILLISCMEGILSSDIDTDMQTDPTLAMPFAYGTFTLDKAPFSIDTISQDILDSLPWVPDSLLDEIDTNLYYEFELTDTSELNLGESFDQIEEATMYLTFRNRFPFDSEYNVILYDSVSNLNIDTVINIFIPASTVINKDVQVTESTDSVVMSSNFNESVEASNQIIVNIIYTVYVRNFGAVDSLSDFSLWFHIGMKAKVTL